MAFKSIPYESLSFNPFTKIGKAWALLTAGIEGDYNTMTVSWGAVGYIWGKPSVTVYVRPQRYTKGFVDREDYFTLSFYPADCKPALGYLGQASGRDGDKVGKVGFTPVHTHGTTYFEEAELVFVCRKISRTLIGEDSFLDKDVQEKNYPAHDFHEMYIAEVVDVLVKETDAE